jgi:hypothetical protein
MMDSHALATSAAKPGTVFLANRMGLFRSPDGGMRGQEYQLPEGVEGTYGLWAA